MDAFEVSVPLTWLLDVLVGQLGLVAPPAAVHGVTHGFAGLADLGAGAGAGGLHRRCLAAVPPTCPQGLEMATSSQRTPSALPLRLGQPVCAMPMLPARCSAIVHMRRGRTVTPPPAARAKEADDSLPNKNCSACRPTWRTRRAHTTRELAAAWKRLGIADAHRPGSAAPAADSVGQLPAKPATSHTSSRWPGRDVPRA